MMVRGRRMLGAVARFSKLADHSERGAGFDSAAVLDQDLRQHASDGRPDFTSDVVGINLDQWFSESDGISGALEPPSDRQLGPSVCNGWRTYLSQHGIDPVRGDYDRVLFEGGRERVAEETGAGDMKVDVDLGASEAGKAFLSHVRTCAVEAVCLLMIDLLDLKTLIKIAPRRRFVGVDDRAL